MLLLLAEEIISPIFELVNGSSPPEIDKAVVLGI